MNNDDMLDLLCTVLPFIEDAEDDPCYKDGVATRLVARVKAAIKTLEAQPPNDYAWQTIADYEREAWEGAKVNQAFTIGWNMARTTNTMLAKLGAAT